MKFTIGTKLFLVMVGLTSAILALVIVLINTTLSSTILDKVIADFHQTQNIFEKTLQLRYERLVESAYLIAENSTFKANVALNDPASVYYSVSEFALFTQVDLFIVTNREGKVLAQYGNPDQQWNDLTTRSSVSRALDGSDYAVELERPELWEVDHGLYQVVSVPVYAGDNIIGTVTLGATFTDVDAEDIKGTTNIDISIFLNQRLITSTLPAELQSLVHEFPSMYQKEIGQVITSLQPTETFELNLQDNILFAFLSPLGIGEAAYYLATVPKSIELRILDVIRNNLFIVAAISLLITIFFAIFLGRIFTKPIRQLVIGMNHVKEGDLTIAVTPSTNDEIGLLTQTFNEMTKGLAERLQLMRYVGDHTRDMIQKSATDHTDNALGKGTKNNLAVLFCDIRGFTSYSEDHLPEEVIKTVNLYLGVQADIVKEFRGSVDKFVGDEMVAIFDGKDALQRAIQCGIEIQNRMRKLRENDGQTLEVGIGINYGSMILGNMGTSDRMDYTIIGSAVNRASRLCASAKPGQILVPKQLLADIGLDINLGTSQMMKFKGISNPVEVTEVLSA